MAHVDECCENCGRELDERRDRLDLCADCAGRDTADQARRNAIDHATRIPLVQSPRYNERHGNCGDAYAEDRCCVCYDKTGPDAEHLCLSRTNDGEWYVVDPREPVREDERDFGRFTLPIGPSCLKNHPEYRFALVEPSRRGEIRQFDPSRRRKAVRDA